MNKKCNTYLFIITNIIAILNLLCYISIRSMWPDIVKYTASYVPYLLLAVIGFTTLTHTFLTFYRKYPLGFAIISILINLVFLALNGTIIYIMLDAAMYFLRGFLYHAFFVLGIIAIYLAITTLHKHAVFQKKWFSFVLLSLLLIIGFLTTYRPVLYNKIETIPAVYAVGDDYQIVFTSKAKGTAWVTINGIEYSDTYAGFLRTEDTVHKIIVPMTALDNATEYTISTRAMWQRGPYGALQGKIIRQTYPWKGVTPEDGLNYYVLSDTHNTQKAPSAAGTYFQNSLDFLVCCGDTASWIEQEEDLTQMLRLAGTITKGSVPVIYARGNHETKGAQAHELHKYVGADGELFYYTFRMKNVWGVVLDIGEDHRDQHENYYDAARFNAYRRAQTQFLDDILKNAEQEFNAEGVEHRIAVCHIPITLMYTNDHARAYKDAWIKRLNRMNLNILYGGHVHQLWYIDDAFEDGATMTLSPHYSGTETGNASRIMTNAKFPAVLVSRRSEGQLLTYPESVFDDLFIGLAVTNDGSYTTLKYTDETHQVLENITCPWFEGIDYGSEIVIPDPD